MTSDRELATSIRSHLLDRAQAGCTSAFVESAGGVHSPTLSGSSQLDAYRPLRLPTVLVASHALGGISATLSAYESLLLRGYDVDAVLCFDEQVYDNASYFARWFAERSIAFASVDAPPARCSELDAEVDSMRKYYRSTTEPLSPIVAELQRRHAARLADLDSAGQRAKDTFWWPFVQHGLVKDVKDVMVIDSAKGDNFAVVKPDTPPERDMIEPTFDGSASWWTQAFGHAPTEIGLAAAHAAGRYGHVMFPTATNAPALELAERLIATVGKGWASRVFYSDDGSTAMEIALKMGLRKRSVNLPKDVDLTQLGIVGISGGYHGDTIGTMDAVSPSAFNLRVEWYRGRGFWFDAPTARIEDGKVVVRVEGEQWGTSTSRVTAGFASLADLYDVEKRLHYDPLGPRYRQHILGKLKTMRKNLGIRLGSLLLEPIVLGAGGMLFVDPLFQRVLVDLARSGALLEASEGVKDPLPVIFDEVFVGLKRIGPMRASSMLGVKPDIACFAKVLTGGIVPMSVTLASEDVFDSFTSDRKIDALLHGHSYTAHAIGCAAANKTLELIERMDSAGRWTAPRADWHVPTTDDLALSSVWDRSFVYRLSELERVDGVMALGLVLAVYLRADDGAGYSSTASQDVLARLRADGIHARPLGNVIYLMASFNSELDHIQAALERALQS